MNDFIGAWETEGEDSSAVFVIASNGDGFAVSGYDKSDNEPFDISNVNFDGSSLSFESRMPSTKHRAKHVMKLLSDGTVEHELTLVEKWKKIEP